MGWLVRLCFLAMDPADRILQHHAYTTHACMHRFNTYRESTMPIIDQFRAQGKLWEVRADRPKGTHVLWLVVVSSRRAWSHMPPHQSQWMAEAVFADVAALFSYKVVFVLGGPGERGRWRRGKKTGLTEPCLFPCLPA